MTHGHFDQENREYVITDPRTPVRWINYVGGLDFGGFLDHTGGGVICKDDPALNRITRYLGIQPPGQFNGESAYLRVRQAPGNTAHASGAAGDGPSTSGAARSNGAHGASDELATARVFSPYWVPTLDEGAVYRCRVGLGYSVFEHELDGIRTETTAFVPPGQRVLVRRYKITNTTKTALQIEAVPVVEYSHFDSLKQLTNADWVPQTMEGRMRRTPGGMPVLFCNAFMHRERQMNFFAASVAPRSWQTDRARFLGNGGWGTWARPRALDQEDFDNYEAKRGDVISALLLNLGVLQPGQSAEFHTILSQGATTEDCLASAEGWLDSEFPDRGLAELRRYWDDYLETLQVSTPSEPFNQMVNVFNPRQSWVTRNWSRYLSLYQTGFGSRGIGTRDSAQDILATMAADPEGSRKLLDLLLSIQRPDGAAMHQINPLSGEASIGDAAELEDRPKYYGDDHLWLVLAVAKYLKETGNFSYLAEEISYYDAKLSPAKRPLGSVSDHVRRALDFTASQTGSHGLPLLGFADWNDTVNLPTGAESSFVACLYGRALNEAAWIAAKMGDADLEKLCRDRHAAMAKTFNEQAWDGQWYLRYYDETGKPIGSRQNEKGKIYTNAQSWAVLAGFAPPDRAVQALDSVRTHLNTANGIKLSAPGYNGYDPHIGGVSTYPPGAKENGGIFLHANPWVIIAETMVGRGDRAFEYYSNINPAAKNDKIEEYECEPYVFAQNILADEHPQFGLGRNSWLSGTSSWMYQAATEYILGIRADGDSLIIDPCIPPDWRGFSASRSFAGTRYEISVENPSGKGRGIASAQVDGQPVAAAGGVLRVGSAKAAAIGTATAASQGRTAGAGKTVQVRIVLG